MTLGENYYYGGLLRFDMTQKPAYLKITELIQKKWHTEETLATDENGNADFRGFYGDYDVEITVDGKTETKKISLNKNGKADFVISI